MSFALSRRHRWPGPCGSDRTLFGAALACALSVTLAAMIGLFAPLDCVLSDAWFNTSQVKPSGQIVIVDISRAVVDQGDGLRLPRARLADLLTRIVGADARRVLVDLSLSGSTTEVDDAKLEAVLAKMPPHDAATTVSAVATSDHMGVTQWRRTSVLERFARRADVVASDLAFDRDGTLRRSGIDGTPLPPLPSAAGWLAGSNAQGMSTNRIDFAIDVRRIPVIDALDLLNERFDASALTGRSVLVSNYAAAIGQDIRVPRFGALPRSEVTALAAETLIRNHPLHALNRLIDSGMLILLGVAATLWVARVAPWIGGVTVLGFVLCALGTAASLQTRTGLLLPAAELVTAMVCGFLTSQVARHPALQRLRDAIAGTFGKGDLRLARVLDETGEALVTFTPDGRVLSMNVAACDLFMHSAGAKGTSIKDLLGTQADALLSATHLSRPGHLEATIGRDAIDRRHLDLKVNAMRDNTGGWIGVASIRDVTAQRVQLDALRRMAREDPLTGLVNRLGFEQALAAGCDGPDLGEDGHGRMMVLMCDLDGFKAVNDSLGHQAGDTLLQVIAQRLRGAVHVGLVARLGGDEFGVIVRAPRIEVADAETIAKEIASAVADTIVIDAQGVRVGVSIGIALYPEAGATPDALVRAADIAMYQAKRTGSGFMVGHRQAA